MKGNKGFFFQLMLAVIGSRTLTADQKQRETRVLNRKSGGFLFSNGPIPGRLPNQRQRRKLNRQLQNF